MKLDRTLFKEVKALAGNGSREAKFALLRRIDAARTDLSTPKARENFNACLSKHGRAVVAVCVAATLDARKDVWTAGTGSGRMRSCRLYPRV